MAPWSYENYKTNNDSGFSGYIFIPEWGAFMRTLGRSMLVLLILFVADLRLNFVDPTIRFVGFSAADAVGCMGQPTFAKCTFGKNWPK